MATKGDATKENILEIAQSLMLQKGFSGTSLDEIISAANITKGGFFYHFESKNDLAKHLMLKYQHDDEIFFNSLFERADELSEDPLRHRLLHGAQPTVYVVCVAGQGSLHPGNLLVTCVGQHPRQQSAVLHRPQLEPGGTQQRA